MDCRSAAVGVDLDGVLGDQVSEVIRRANDKFGIGLSYEDITEWDLKIGDSSFKPLIAEAIAGFDYNYQTVDPSDSSKTIDTSLVQRVTDQAGNTTTYSYDERDRLANANTTGPNPASYQYSYDLANNRLTEALADGVTIGYSYNEANELMTVGAGAAGSGNYTYDANGNELGNTAGLVLNYNAADQTTKATRPGVPSANSIGYLGPNQIDRVSADATNFKSSALGLRMQDPAPGISESAYYIRDPEGNLIGARREGHIRYYYLFDGLGSVVGLVSEGGTLLRTYKYDPFGNITSNIDHTGSAPTDYFRFRSGFQADGGLYHFGMRYYDPRIGRFTQTDPIPDPGGNPYAYAGCDPVNNEDPSGLLYVQSCRNAVIPGGPVGTIHTQMAGRTVTWGIHFSLATQLRHRYLILQGLTWSSTKVRSYSPHINNTDSGGAFHGRFTGTREGQVISFLFWGYNINGSGGVWLTGTCRA
jgi:RHS repeat-associated protein